MSKTWQKLNKRRIAMSKGLNRFLLLLCAAIMIFSMDVASATVLEYTDFSSTSGLTLNGEAAVTTTSDGQVLRIVPAEGYIEGSAFSSTAINVSTFGTEFKFRLTEPGGGFDGTGTGADGFVFVIQYESPTAIGDGGGGQGYKGIEPAVGVEFDTWLNTEVDLSSNNLEIYNGYESLAYIDVSPNFDDGSLWFAWINYDGTTLEVRANQTGVRSALPLLSCEVDIPYILGTSMAFVGFTAATGAGWENHDIISWKYVDSYNPDVSVPEPATMLLLGFGLIGLWGFRRKFKK
jgi:hypothetical protein